MEMKASFGISAGDFSLQAQMDTADRRNGILGASGCGKSMTLKALAGILTPDEGRIELGGRVLFDSRAGINVPARERGGCPGGKGRSHICWFQIVVAE